MPDLPPDVGRARRRPPAGGAARRQPGGDGRCRTGDEAAGRVWRRRCCRGGGEATRGRTARLRVGGRRGRWREAAGRPVVGATQLVVGAWRLIEDCWRKGGVATRRATRRRLSECSTNNYPTRHTPLRPPFSAGPPSQRHRTTHPAPASAAPSSRPAAPSSRPAPAAAAPPPVPRPIVVSAQRKARA